MAYKDKDKQREADKARQQRRRDVIKAKGVTNIGCDGQGVTIPKSESHVDTSDVGAVKTLHRLIKALPVTVTESKSSVTGVCCVDHTCNFTGKMTVMERLFYRPASKLGRGETNFVSLPGRACYGVV